jgi:tRNA nucleotidyltransferase/poly(A) polymerase
MGTNNKFIQFITSFGNLFKTKKMTTIDKEVLQICMAIENAGGLPFIVGGTVRDIAFARLTGKKVQSKDWDIEVHEMTSKALLAVLKPFGKIGEVGESFEVIKLVTPSGADFDFNLPRRETKVGTGHKGFEVVADPHMGLKEACQRRDFTLNALLMNPFTGEVVDLFGGLDDLKEGILRATSDKFAEDPLRVLRAMQFAARFELQLDKGTVEMCKELRVEFGTIAKERLWTEFEKMLMKGTKPSLGLQVLMDTTWVSEFAELQELQVSGLKRTMKALDKMSNVCEENEITGNDKLVLMLSALTGEMSTKAAKRFLLSVNCPDASGKRVLSRVLDILSATEFFFLNLGHFPFVDQVVRLTLGRHLKKNSKEIWMFAVDNQAGVGFNMSVFFSACNKIADVGQLKPLVTGTILQENGWTPREHKANFGKELTRLHQEQLIEGITDLEFMVGEIKTAP